MTVRQRIITATTVLTLLLATSICHCADISGATRLWHTVTLSFAGPKTSEAAEPNPFLDYRLDVVFRHEQSNKNYIIPGYFAADGKAGETSADSGNIWRVRFSPDKTGKWSYKVSFRTGNAVAVADSRNAGKSAGYCDGETGSFRVTSSDKSWPDFRARGRLEYVRERYLQFAGSKEYFLKAGPDSPETLLAYKEFDGTSTLGVPLKTFSAHLGDWKPGNPTWKGGKGRGLIGALNYLASKGMNTVSFLTYNNGGDGKNVWPFISPKTKIRYDCSKLDQWGIVFDYAQTKGIHLSFKTQETENDNEIPQSLDGGGLGTERKLYYRELIARYGHLLALTWNLGEENSQTTAQQKDMAHYFRTADPYHRNIVIHTFPSEVEKVYKPLLGSKSDLTGASLQTGWSQVHDFTMWWVWESKQAKKPWVVSCDEQGGANTGVPPDAGYDGYKPAATNYTIDDIRKSTLWGNLMAGGAGVEYYFGYQLPCDDLLCEDWRSRDKSWSYAHIALEFFRKQNIPINRMFCTDRLTAAKDDYCFFSEGEIYLIYRSTGGRIEFNIPQGTYTTGWFNPRTGDGMSALLWPKTVEAQTQIDLQTPDDNDWLLVVRKAS